LPAPNRKKWSIKSKDSRSAGRPCLQAWPASRICVKTHMTCHPEPRSSVIPNPDQVSFRTPSKCHSEPRSSCHSEPRSSCHSEPRSSCHSEPPSSCHSEPRLCVIPSGARNLALPGVYGNPALKARPWRDSSSPSAPRNDTQCVCVCVQTNSSGPAKPQGALRLRHGGESTLKWVFHGGVQAMQFTSLKFSRSGLHES